MFPKSKALRTERDFSHVIEIAVPGQGFDIQISREIELFHRLRDIRPRYGRPSTRNDQPYCRYCFADPTTADAFREQFGGAPVMDKLHAS